MDLNPEFNSPSGEPGNNPRLQKLIAGIGASKITKNTLFADCLYRFQRLSYINRQF
jgi:hypothetical protein